MRHTIALLALFAAGCTDGSPAPGNPPPPQPVAPALLLSSSRPGFEAGLTSRQFRFVELRDLWVRAQLPSIPQVAVEHLSFVNPAGEMFYEELVPFSLDPTVKTVALAQMGMNSPHDTQVFAAQTIPGGVALDHPVAIGGTIFERYPARGSWQLEARIDGAGTLTTSFDVVE
jgi:hypothetical protein